MGYVALRPDEALVRQVDGVLAELQAHSEIAALAAGNGLTLMPPRTPDVRGDVDTAALNGD